MITLNFFSIKAKKICSFIKKNVFLVCSSMLANPRSGRFFSYPCHPCGDYGYITAAAAKGRKLIYKVDYLGILKMGSLPCADLMYT